MIEYRIISVNLYMDEDELNALGRDGWQLVQILTERDTPPRYHFARLKRAEVAWAEMAA